MIVKRIFAALLAIGLAAAPSAGQRADPDADTIIARHIDARGGGAALRAIRSLAFTQGRYSEPGYESDGKAEMRLMRPYHKLVGNPSLNPDFMEGYDGEAWEWFKDPGIVIRTTSAASEAIRHYADVEGPFLDYRAKGSTAELLGTEAIDGKPAYKVRLTMMDGYTTDSFFDAKTYMLVASRHTAAVHAFGTPVSSQTRFADFRKVAGVLFPFRSEEVEIATGKKLNAMQWGRIEANSSIPAAWFSPPEFTRTAMQTFIEQLYRQRSDPKAVLWTYHAFRRANPNVDTQDAAQVAGFQSLKMGAIDSAIALLERNAKDNPTGANAAFGLGRAYAQAGRVADARAEYQRALALDPKHDRAAKALADLPK